MRSTHTATLPRPIRHSRNDPPCASRFRFPMPPRNACDTVFSVLYIAYIANADGCFTSSWVCCRPP